MCLLGRESESDGTVDARRRICDDGDFVSEALTFGLCKASFHRPQFFSEIRVLKGILIISADSVLRLYSNMSSCAAVREKHLIRSHAKVPARQRSMVEKVCIS